MSAERSQDLTKRPEPRARRRELERDEHALDGARGLGERRLAQAIRERKSDPFALVGWLHGLPAVDRYVARLLIVRELGVERGGRVLRQAFGDAEHLGTRAASATRRPGVDPFAEYDRGRATLLVEAIVRRIARRDAGTGADAMLLVEALEPGLRPQLASALRSRRLGEGPSAPSAEQVLLKATRGRARTALAGPPVGKRAVATAPRAAVVAADRKQTGSALGADDLQVLARAEGERLPQELERRLSRLLGHDFSHVRIHTDAVAAATVERLGAKAVTVGTQIFFNSGYFAPGTPTGDRLLVHELTHVVQHDHGRLPARGEGFRVTSPTETVERDAKAAERLADRLPSPTVGAARGGRAAAPSKSEAPTLALRDEAASAQPISAPRQPPANAAPKAPAPAPTVPDVANVGRTPVDPPSAQPADALVAPGAAPLHAAPDTAPSTVSEARVPQPAPNEAHEDHVETPAEVATVAGKGIAVALPPLTLPAASPGNPYTQFAHEVDAGYAELRGRAEQTLAAVAATTHRAIDEAVKAAEAQLHALQKPAGTVDALIDKHAANSRKKIIEREAEATRQASDLHARRTTGLPELKSQMLAIARSVYNDATVWPQLAVIGKEVAEEVRERGAREVRKYQHRRDLEAKRADERAEKAGHYDTIGDEYGHVYQGALTWTQEEELSADRLRARATAVKEVAEAFAQQIAAQGAAEVGAAKARGVIADQQAIERLFARYQAEEEATYKAVQRGISETRKQAEQALDKQVVQLKKQLVAQQAKQAKEALSAIRAGAKEKHGKVDEQLALVARAVEQSLGAARGATLRQLSTFNVDGADRSDPQKATALAQVSEELKKNLGLQADDLLGKIQQQGKPLVELLKSNPLAVAKEPEPSKKGSGKKPSQGSGGGSIDDQIAAMFGALDKRFAGLFTELTHKGTDALNQIKYPDFMRLRGQLNKQIEGLPARFKAELEQTVFQRLPKLMDEAAEDAAKQVKPRWHEAAKLGIMAGGLVLAFVSGGFLIALLGGGLFALVAGGAISGMAVTALQTVANNWLDDKKLTDDLFQSVISAGIAGAVGGGLLGPAGQLLKSGALFPALGNVARIGTVVTVETAGNIGAAMLGEAAVGRDPFEISAIVQNGAMSAVISLASMRVFGARVGNTLDGLGNIGVRAGERVRGALGGSSLPRGPSIAEHEQAEHRRQIEELHARRVDAVETVEVSPDHFEVKQDLRLPGPSQQPQAQQPQAQQPQAQQPQAQQPQAQQPQAQQPQAQAQQPQAQQPQAQAQQPQAQQPQQQQQPTPQVIDASGDKPAFSVAGAKPKPAAGDDFAALLEKPAPRRAWPQADVPSEAPVHRGPEGGADNLRELLTGKKDTELQKLLDKPMRPEPEPPSDFARLLQKDFKPAERPAETQPTPAPRTRPVESFADLLKPELTPAQERAQAFRQRGGQLVADESALQGLSGQGSAADQIAQRASEIGERMAAAKAKNKAIVEGLLTEELGELGALQRRGEAMADPAKPLGSVDDYLAFSREIRLRAREQADASSSWNGIVAEHHGADGLAKQVANAHKALATLDQKILSRLDAQFMGQADALRALGSDRWAMSSPKSLQGAIDRLWAQAKLPSGWEGQTGENQLAVWLGKAQAHLAQSAAKAFGPDHGVRFGPAPVEHPAPTHAAVLDASADRAAFSVAGQGDSKSLTVTDERMSYRGVTGSFSSTNDVRVIHGVDAVEAKRIAVQIESETALLEGLLKGKYGSAVAKRSAVQESDFAGTAAGERFGNLRSGGAGVPIDELPAEVRGKANLTLASMTEDVAAMRDAVEVLASPQGQAAVEKRLGRKLEGWDQESRAAGLLKARQLPSQRPALDALKKLHGSNLLELNTDLRSSLRFDPKGNLVDATDVLVVRRGGPVEPEAAKPVAEAKAAEAAPATAAPKLDPSKVAAGEGHGVEVGLWGEATEMAEGGLYQPVADGAGRILGKQLSRKLTSDIASRSKTLAEFADFLGPNLRGKIDTHEAVVVDDVAGNRVASADGWTLDELPVGVRKQAEQALKGVQEQLVKLQEISGQVRDIVTDKWIETDSLKTTDKGTRVTNRLAALEAKLGGKLSIDQLRLSERLFPDANFEINPELGAFARFDPRTGAITQLHHVLVPKDQIGVKRAMTQPKPLVPRDLPVGAAGDKAAHSIATRAANDAQPAVETVRVKVGDQTIDVAANVEYEVIKIRLADGEHEALRILPKKWVVEPDAQGQGGVWASKLNQHAYALLHNRGEIAVHVPMEGRAGFHLEKARIAGVSDDAVRTGRPDVVEAHEGGVHDYQSTAVLRGEDSAWLSRMESTDGKPMVAGTHDAYSDFMVGHEVPANALEARVFAGEALRASASDPARARQVLEELSQSFRSGVARQSAELHERVLAAIGSDPGSVTFSRQTVTGKQGAERTEISAEIVEATVVVGNARVTIPLVGESYLSLVGRPEARGALLQALTERVQLVASSSRAVEQRLAKVEAEARRLAATPEAQWKPEHFDALVNVTSEAQGIVKPLTHLEQNSFGRDAVAAFNGTGQPRAAGASAGRPEQGGNGQPHGAGWIDATQDQVASSVAGESGGATGSRTTPRDSRPLLRELSRERIEKLLAEHPNSREILIELLESGQMPANVQRVLAEALRLNPEVHNLTAERRAQHGVPDVDAVAHYASSSKFEVVDSWNGTSKTANDYELRDLPDSAVVMASDRVPTSESSDFSSIIHELAHIRFQSFLERNIERLAIRYPQFVRRAGGKFEVDQHFFDYIQERYAIQVQFQTTKAVHEAGKAPWDERSWGPEYDLVGKSDSRVNALISKDWVVGPYNIDAPSIRRATQNRATLGSVLRGTARDLQPVHGPLRQRLRSSIDATQDQPAGHLAAGSEIPNEVGAGALGEAAVERKRLVDAFHAKFGERAVAYRAVRVPKGTSLEGRYNGYHGEGQMVVFDAKSAVRYGHKPPGKIPGGIENADEVVIMRFEITPEQIARDPYDTLEHVFIGPEVDVKALPGYAEYRIPASALDDVASRAAFEGRLSPERFSVGDAPGARDPELLRVLEAGGDYPIGSAQADAKLLAGIRQATGREVALLHLEDHVSADGQRVPGGHVLRLGDAGSVDVRGARQVVAHSQNEAEGEPTPAARAARAARQIELSDEVFSAPISVAFNGGRLALAMDNAPASLRNRLVSIELHNEAEGLDGWGSLTGVVIADDGAGRMRLVEKDGVEHELTLAARRKQYDEDVIELGSGRRVHSIRLGRDVVAEPVGEGEIERILARFAHFTTDDWSVPLREAADPEIQQASAYVHEPGDRSVKDRPSPGSVENRMRHGRSYEDALAEAGIDPELAHLFDPSTGRLLPEKLAPAALAMENGAAPLRAIRMNWEPKSDRSAKVLDDHLRLLAVEPTVALWIVAHPTVRDVITSRLASAPEGVRARVTLAEVSDNHIDIWAQDGSKPLESGNATLARRFGNQDWSRDEQRRQFRQENAIEALHTSGLVDQATSTLRFEGGNVIVGGLNIFVGTDIVQTVVRDLKVSRSQAIGLLERQFGRPVIEIGYPTGGSGKIGQNSFHIDLDMAVAVDRTSADRHDVIVAQSTYELLRVAFGMPPIEQLKVNEFAVHMRNAVTKMHEAAVEQGRRLSDDELRLIRLVADVQPSVFYAQEIKQRAIIKDLTARGYSVRTVPGFADFVSGDSRLRAFNYTNVILSGDKALVPAYGIAALDAAAHKVYADLGYEVIPAHSTKHTLRAKGGIRCATETYREPTPEGSVAAHAPSEREAFPALPAPEPSRGPGFQSQETLRRAEFASQARESGLTEAQAVELFEIAGGVKRDQVTGFERAEARVPTLERAIEWVRNNPEYTAIYVEGDIANLSGLNGALGASTANIVYRKLAQVLSQKLRAIGVDQSDFRHGGDEISSILVGKDLTIEKVQQAFAEAHAEVAAYVRETVLTGINGEPVALAGIVHPKHLGDARFNGTGLSLGAAEITGNSTAKKVFGEADRQVEADKLRKGVSSPGDAPSAPEPAVKMAAGSVLEPGTLDKRVMPERAPEAADQPHAKAVGFRGEMDELRAQFVARARQLNPEITEAQAEQMFRSAGGEARDTVTGFEKGEGRVPTVVRAMEFVRAHAARGIRAFYAEIDLRNLGGLNAVFGHSGADEIFHFIAKTVHEELNAVGADLVPFRHGGDEISFVVVGENLSEAMIEAAMARAQARIREFVEKSTLKTTASGAEHPVTAIAHPKHLADTSYNGTGISHGVTEIVPPPAGRTVDDQVSSIFGQADRRVEMMKKGGGPSAPGGEREPNAATRHAVPEPSPAAASMAAAASNAGPGMLGGQRVGGVVHFGADAVEHVARAQRLGLMPQQAVRVGEVEYKVGAIFDIGGGRVAALFEVEVAGERYLRVAYRSNSQGSWRILPARSHLKLVPGFDKPVSEHAISLPSEVDELLSANLGRGQVRRDVSEADANAIVEGAVPVNRSPEEYGRYMKSADYLGNHVREQHLLNEVPYSQRLSTKSGEDVPPPGQVQIATPGQHPDFGNLLREYRSSTSVAGEVDAYVYRSFDGSLEYVVYRDATNRIWFKSISKLDSKITPQGVRDVAIDPGALCTPIWEYRDLLPREYVGVRNSVEPNYVDAWAYVRQFPEIQAWYRATGRTMPGRRTADEAKQHAEHQPAIEAGDRSAGRGVSGQPNTYQPRAGELVTYQSKSGNFYRGRYGGLDADGNVLLDMGSGMQPLSSARLVNVRPGASVPELHAYGPDDVITLYSVRGNPRTGRIIGYTEEGNIRWQPLDGEECILRTEQINLGRVERAANLGGKP